MREDDMSLSHPVVSDPLKKFQTEKNYTCRYNVSLFNGTNIVYEFWKNGQQQPNRETILRTVKVVNSSRQEGKATSLSFG